MQCLLRQNDMRCCDAAGMQPKGLWADGQRKPAQKYRAIMDGLTAQMDALDAAVADAAHSLPEMSGDAQRRLSELAEGAPALQDVQVAAAHAAGSDAPAAAALPVARDFGGPQWGATEVRAAIVKHTALQAAQLSVDGMF